MKTKTRFRTRILTLLLAAAASVTPLSADDIAQNLILGNQISQFVEDFSLKMDEWELIQKQVNSVVSVTERLQKYGKGFTTAASIAQTTSQFYRTADTYYRVVGAVQSLCSRGVLTGSWAIRAYNVYTAFLSNGYKLLSETGKSLKSFTELTKSGGESVVAVGDFLDRAAEKCNQGFWNYREKAREDLSEISREADSRIREMEEKDCEAALLRRVADSRMTLALE